MATPTKQQILQLYRSYLSTAQSFSSYNFRTYFLRRSRDLFRSNLLPASQANYASPFSKASGLTTPVVPPTMASEVPAALEKESMSGRGESDEVRLSTFFETAKKDLDVLRRAALTNRMYEGDKLVVERPQLIVGGGGAGAEASTGGAGQPTAGPQSGGGAPPSDTGPDGRT